MKEYLQFIVLFMTLVGAIGTIGYLLYCKAWVILIGALLVDMWAYKPFMDAVKELLM